MKKPRNRGKTVAVNLTINEDVKRAFHIYCIQHGLEMSVVTEGLYRGILETQGIKLGENAPPYPAPKPPPKDDDEPPTDKRIGFTSRKKGAPAVLYIPPNKYDGTDGDNVTPVIVR